MKKTLENFIQTKREVVNSMHIVFSEIQEDLQKMVQEEKFLSFSFMRNDIYFDNQHPVYISIAKKSNDSRDLRLGVMPDIEKLTAEMSPDILDKLKEINSTLCVLNENFLSDLPIINQSSYYSKKALNKEGGFLNENILLLPMFHYPQNQLVEKTFNKKKIR